MPDLDNVVQMVCWSNGTDDSGLAEIDEATLKMTIDKLAQPLASYLVQCQELEKAGLWEKVSPLGLFTPPDDYSENSQKLQAFVEAMQEVLNSLSDLPANARAPLMRQLIPHLEKQLASQFPGYRMLVYETKKAVQAQEVQKRENARKSKVDDRVFWVIVLIFITISLIVEFKTGWLFNLNDFSSKFTSANGWARVWLITRVPLAALVAFAVFGPISIWIAGLFRKASDTLDSVKPIDFSSHPEEQNWVWLCQRCEFLEPYLLEEDMDCPRCGNRMTRVRGQWGRQ